MPNQDINYAVELAQTNFGKIITNPLASRTIRWLLGLLVSVLATKVFKIEAGTLPMEDWIELVMVLIASGAVAWYRFKATGQIGTVATAVEELLPVVQRATTPAMRQNVLDLIKSKNSKVHEAIVEVLKES